MNTITHEGQNFEISTEGSDIVLHGIHRDLIIVGGYDQLKRVAERYCQREFTEHDDSTSIDYDRDHVDYEIDQRMEGFVTYKLKAGEFKVLIDHNVN